MPPPTRAVADIPVIVSPAPPTPPPEFAVATSVDDAVTETATPVRMTNASGPIRLWTTAPDWISASEVPIPTPPRSPIEMIWDVAVARFVPVAVTKRPFVALSTVPSKSAVVPPFSSAVGAFTPPLIRPPPAVFVVAVARLNDVALTVSDPVVVMCAVLPTNALTSPVDVTCASTPEPVSEKPKPMLSAFVSAVAWFEPFAWTVTWDAELTEPSRRAVTAPPIFDVAKKTPPLMMPTPVEWVSAGARFGVVWPASTRTAPVMATVASDPMPAKTSAPAWISAFATAPDTPPMLKLTRSAVAVAMFELRERTVRLNPAVSCPSKLAVVAPPTLAVGRRNEIAIAPTAALVGVADAWSTDEAVTRTLPGMLIVELSPTPADTSATEVTSASAAAPPPEKRPTAMSAVSAVAVFVALAWTTTDAAFATSAFSCACVEPFTFAVGTETPIATRPPFAAFVVAVAVLFADAKTMTDPVETMRPAPVRAFTSPVDVTSASTPEPVIEAKPPMLRAFVSATASLCPVAVTRTEEPPTEPSSSAVTAPPTSALPKKMPALIRPTPVDSVSAAA